MSTYPQVGQVLRINLVTLQEDEASVVYKARVTDLTSDVMSIEVPIDEKTGRGYRIPDGTPIGIWYTGDDGSRYDVRTEVIGHRSDHIPVLLVKLPDAKEIKRTQRRNYLRVDVQLEMAVKFADHVRNYHFLTRTSDISGGGLSFSCSDQYRIKEQDRLQIWLLIPLKNGTIMHAYAEGEVIRCRPNEAGRNLQWVSVKFVHISESDQAKVVRACYERQLELRRRGITE